LISIHRALILALAAIASATAAAAPAPNPAKLELASVQAAVTDLDSDTTLYRKHAQRSVPIASLTKLLTAIVVLESDAALDEWLPVVERRESAPNNAYTRMRVGSQLKRKTYLRLALMASANHGAYVLARHHPGGFDAFVDDMNDQARALGMDASHFVDPSGLSILNHASAADVVTLIEAAMAYPLIRESTQTQAYTARFRYPRYELYYGNTNVLVFRNHWDVRLSKTGYLDEAGRCLAMVARIDGRLVAMALLDSFGTRSPVGDAGRIKRWLRSGESGAVADAAARYEKRRNRAYARRDGLTPFLGAPSSTLQQAAKRE